MSDLSDLKTIKSQIIAQLKDLTASPKPTYMIDGQMVSWGDYQRMLFEQLKTINEEIQGNEPFEVHSQGYA